VNTERVRDVISIDVEVIVTVVIDIFVVLALALLFLAALDVLLVVRPAAFIVRISAASAAGPVLPVTLRLVGDRASSALAVDTKINLCGTKFSERCRPTFSFNREISEARNYGRGVGGKHSLERATLLEAKLCEATIYFLRLLLLRGECVLADAGARETAQKGNASRRAVLVPKRLMTTINSHVRE
ncbi:hypothetical protein PC128_g25421, partial [Phytophthora cactorum]